MNNRFQFIMINRQINALAGGGMLLKGEKIPAVLTAAFGDIALPQNPKRSDWHRGFFLPDKMRG